MVKKMCKLEVINCEPYFFAKQLGCLVKLVSKIKYLSPVEVLDSLANDRDNILISVVQQYNMALSLSRFLSAVSIKTVNMLQPVVKLTPRHRYFLEEIDTHFFGMSLAKPNTRNFCYTRVIGIFLQKKENFIVCILAKKKGSKQERGKVRK